MRPPAETSASSPSTFPALIIEPQYAGRRLIVWAALDPATGQVRTARTLPDLLADLRGAHCYDATIYDSSRRRWTLRADTPTTTA